MEYSLPCAVIRGVGVWVVGRMSGNLMPDLSVPTGPPPLYTDHGTLAVISQRQGRPERGQTIQNEHSQRMRLAAVVAQFGPPFWPQIPVQGVYRK